MSTDAATTTTPVVKEPTDDWFERQEHAVAGVLQKLDPFARMVAADIEAAAADTWKASAAALDVLITRNDTELAQNIEKAIMAELLTLAPGVAPAADVLAALALGETKKFLDFAKAKLEAQAATPLAPMGPPLVAPPSPTPTP